jgi:quercetin dioxygenase-like cupin family protein
MIKTTTLATVLLAGAMMACNNPENPEAIKHARESGNLVFSRGERINNVNFVGKAWLNSLIEADSINFNAVGSVTFEPGGRTNWHLHPGGQIVMAIGGLGYYQERGSLKIILHQGDVVKCPPNIPHWHGAGPDEEYHKR